MAACGGGDAGLKEVPEGKLAPESATMKWEQEFPAGAAPAHVIRRFTSPDARASVAGYYNEALVERGWSAELSRPDYAEWSHEGMIVSLVFDTPAGGGSEWSLALFAPE